MDGGNRVVPNAILPAIDFKVAAMEATGSYQCGPWRPHGMAFKQAPAGSGAAPAGTAQATSTLQPTVQPRVAASAGYAG